MARENFYIRLQCEDGQEYFLLNGKEKNYNTDDLVSAIRLGIKNRTIKFGKQIVEEDYTKYIFNVESFSEEKNDFYNAKFSIMVLEKDKKNIKAVSKLEALTTTQIKLKNKNKTRLAAGILIGVTILTMAIPAITKGLDKLLRKDAEYGDAKYTQHQEFLDSIEPNITFEDQITAQKEYYKDLSERAKEGDKAAIDELSKYLVEQQLQEQAEQSQEQYRIR